MVRVDRGRVSLRLVAPLKPCDGVVFETGRPDENEEGGRVYEVRPPGRDGLTVLAFGDGDLDFSRIHVGDKLWKTDDPALNRRLRQSFAGDKPHFLRALDLTVHGSVGAPLTLIGRDELGHVSQAVSAMPLARAEKQPLTTERLTEQFGRLGGTPFKMGHLDTQLDGLVLVPGSEFNRLRREIVADLEGQRVRPKRWQLVERGTRNAERGIRNPENVSITPRLIVLVRSLDQLEAALRLGGPTADCEFADPKKYP